MGKVLTARKKSRSDRPAQHPSPLLRSASETAMPRRLPRSSESSPYPHPSQNGPAVNRSLEEFTPNPPGAASSYALARCGGPSAGRVPNDSPEHVAVTSGCGGMRMSKQKTQSSERTASSYCTLAILAAVAGKINEKVLLAAAPASAVQPCLAMLAAYVVSTLVNSSLAGLRRRKV